jgi:hypothetical protein
VSHGLAPRPELAPEELAAVVAAAQIVLARRAVATSDQTPAWRFSGRWFHGGPLARRRPVRPL